MKRPATPRGAGGVRVGDRVVGVRLLGLVFGLGCLGFVIGVGFCGLGWRWLGFRIGVGDSGRGQGGWVWGLRLPWGWRLGLKVGTPGHAC